MSMEQTIKSRKWLRLNGISLFFLYCVILFIAYARYYFADQLPMSGDAINWITDLTLVKNALAQGELPFWNKFLLGGIPFAPNYTPIMLLGFLPVKQMVYALYIGIVAWGGAATYSYLKRIGCTKWAALAVSACYLLSIHLGGMRKSHTLLVFTIALLPVILDLVERYFADRRLRWLLAASAVMALQFCIGFPQQVVYADIFIAVYLIAFGLHYRMKLKKMLLDGLAWAAAYFGLIAWKIAPMLEQMRVYTADGADGTIDFGSFVSFSIHPIKLLQTVFPKVFGADNYYQAFSYNISSEMDVELFLGHMLLLLFFVGAVYLIRNFRVRFALACMLVTFVYAMSGNVEELSQLLYHIPLINGFRVPSRALFLFLFSAFTVAALALSEMKDPEFRKRASRLATVAAGVILTGAAVAVFTAVVVTGVQQGFTMSSFSPVENYTRTCLAWDGIRLALCLVLFRIAAMPWTVRKKYAYQAACVAAAALTLLETLPFTLLTQPASVASLQTDDPTSIRLKQELGDGKVWDAFGSIDGTHNSIISLNRATSKEIPALNAYITFNNPRLYRMLTQEETAPMNYSGLLTGSMNADQNVHMQNSLLSMLGVKYLIDSSGYIAADTSSYRLQGIAVPVVERSEIDLPYLTDSIPMFFELFQPKPDTYYEFNAICYAGSEQMIYFDFYGGPAYDSPLQELVFNLTPGENALNGLICSGDMNDVSPDSVYWRIVSLANEDIVLKDVSLTESALTEERDTYRYWGDDCGTPIYLNTKARDILYVPDRLEWIGDEEELFHNTWLYALDHVNYVAGGYDWELHPDAVSIADVDFGYGRIDAHVSSSESTFVNFSQCWYPGWHAYVNGKEVPLERVNGLIMGAEVPAGDNTLTFRYVPKAICYGAAVSAATIVLLIAVLLIQKRKHRMTLSKEPQNTAAKR